MNNKQMDRSATGHRTLDMRRRGDWKESVQIARTETAVTAELQLCARPSKRSGSFPEQARSSYRNLLRELQAQRFRLEDIVTEKVFFSDIGAQMKELQSIRAEFFANEIRSGAPLPATSFIQQPPAHPGQQMEIQVYALAPADGSRWKIHKLLVSPTGVSGKIIESKGLRQIFLGNLTSVEHRNGMDLQGQAASIFHEAEAMLSSEGFTFQDVARTWIYLEKIADNYGALNQARTEFFTTRRIHRNPASTGIQGVPFPPDRTFSLDLRAFRGRNGIRMEMIHSPIMNEADAYGSCFSRGMRVELEDRTLLFLSGTASINTKGEVVHAGHIEGQVSRMLMNIESLLAGQNATADNLVSLITYLKRPEYLQPFQTVFLRRGFSQEIPNTITVADVCRPEWLCEMEAMAVLGNDWD